jgi:actin-related protein 5
MAPSAIDEAAALHAPPERTYPPAKIFPVKEVKFEKPIAVQVDGREKALAQPAGTTAIVIDNGEQTCRYPPYMRLMKL